MTNAIFTKSQFLPAFSCYFFFYNIALNLRHVAHKTEATQGWKRIPFSLRLVTVNRVQRKCIRNLLWHLNYKWPTRRVNTFSGLLGRSGTKRKETISRDSHKGKISCVSCLHILAV